MMHVNEYDVPVYKYDQRSFSQMQTWARCGEQYRLQKVEKVPEQQTAWAPMGTAFHAGVEAWEKSCRVMFVDDAVELAVVEYDRIIADQRAKAPDDSMWLTGGRTKVQTDIDRRRERVIQYVREYVDYSLEHEHEFRPATLPDGRPAVEVPFTITVNGTTQRGFIDMILEWPERGVRTVRDLKAGNKLPTDPLQLALYGLAWWRMFGDMIEYGDFFMCKNRGPTEPFYLLDYPEEYIGAWCEMFDRAERQGIYVASSGDHCRVCTVRPYCPLMGARSKAQAYLMPTMRPDGLNYAEQIKERDDINQ